MEPLVTFIGLAAWAGAGLVASRLLSREAVTRRRLERSRPVAVREFPPGRIAKVVGTIRCLGTPLLAPLSGRRCAFYQVWVRTPDARITPGAPPTEWRGQDFVLVDAAGAGALVRAENAVVAIDRDVRATIGMGGHGDPRARAYLDALAARAPYAPTPNVPLEIVEGVLAEGELVAACGVGTFEPDPVPDASTGATAGYRGVPQRLVLRATEASPLLLSDDPRTTR